MPILKNTTPDQEGVNCPYPSWDVVADTVGLQQQCDAQDRRADNEARLWRELANEPPSTEMNAMSQR